MRELYDSTCISLLIFPPYCKLVHNNEKKRYKKNNRTMQTSQSNTSNSAQPTQQPPPAKERRLGSIAKFYLYLYNTVLAYGWTYLLFLVVRHYLLGRPFTELYSVVEIPLKLFQTFAIMEIVHSIVGLVPSPIFTTVMQVWSRLFVVWFIIDLENRGVHYTESQSFFIATVLIAWSITEIVRYNFYAFNLYGICPYILTWLRYTLFLVLYPMGVGSELALIYFRLGYYRENRPFSLELPNKLNWSFDSYIFVWLMILGYVPGFPQLFGYMLRQRKKVLNPETKTSAEARRNT